MNQVDVRNGDKEKKEEDCYWRTAKFSWGLFHGWHLFHDFKKQILHGWGLLHYFINQILHLKIWKKWEKKITTNIFRSWGNSSKAQEILTLYLAQISSYTLSDFEAFKCWHSTEKIYKWPGQYGFGNDWWINRSKMRLNQSEITILNHPKITITTQEQHYNYNTQYYHPCFGAI